LRIDGISAEKPAQRAGLLESDIIIKIGSITIGDIYDYMNSLGKLHKGDTTAVIVIRDNDTLSIDVIF
jgi:S1-C subfamily serine protease